MSDAEKQQLVNEEIDEEEVEYVSDTESGEPQQTETGRPQPRGQPKGQGQRTMQRERQNQVQNPQLPRYNQTSNQQVIPAQDQRVTGNMGGRTGAIRESRIKDRPMPQETRDSSLKIKIELDLEVEVDLYARVKGDVTIGLM